MTRADLYRFPTYEPSQCATPGCGGDAGYTRYCDDCRETWAAFEVAKTRELIHARLMQRRYRRAWEGVLYLAALVALAAFAIGIWP